MLSDPELKFHESRTRDSLRMRVSSAGLKQRAAVLGLDGTGNKTRVHKRVSSI